MRDHAALLRKGLESALEQCGLTWASTLGDAPEVAVFGSRAVAAAAKCSDWDVFAVGGHHRKHLGTIDLVWLSPELLHSRAWLGSELAGHIAHYGVWLVGSADWRERTFVSSEAIRRKRTRIERRVRTLTESWSRLTTPYRLCWLTMIRRDLQRLVSLLEGKSVCPTPNLDARWRSHDEPVGRFTELLQKTGFSNSFARLGDVANYVRIEPENAVIARLERDALRSEGVGLSRSVATPSPGVGEWSRFVEDYVADSDPHRWDGRRASRPR